MTKKWNQMDRGDKMLDMSAIGMQFHVLKTAADTDGKSLDLHWDLLPGCNMKEPLVHIHPHAIETYEILAGEMEFYIKDHWITARQGDKLVVEKGVTHAFRNPTNEIVKVYNTHEPAFRMEEYFRDVCKVLDKLTDKGRKELKMNFRTKLYLSVLMNKYRHEIIAKSPPDMAIRVLGMIAKMAGIRY